MFFCPRARSTTLSGTCSSLLTLPGGQRTLAPPRARTRNPCPNLGLGNARTLRVSLCTLDTLHTADNGNRIQALAGILGRALLKPFPKEYHLNLSELHSRRHMSQQTPVERTPKNKEINEQSRALPVLPVRDTVLFPHAVLPLTVGRESSVQLINSLGEDKTIIVVAQREARVDAPATQRSLHRRNVRRGSQSRQDAQPEPVCVCRRPGARAPGRVHATDAVHERALRSDAGRHDAGRNV